jgi:hypothetical protein
MFLYAAWRAIITSLFAIFFAHSGSADLPQLQVGLKGSRWLPRRGVSGLLQPWW